MRGDLRVNGVDVAAGDGAAVADVPELRLLAGNEAEFLLFDLA